MPKYKTILFAPLNWGLGHATRIVPLINDAINNGHKVIIAADGAALSFLHNEFPNIQHIKLKGFNIRYWRKPFFNLGLLVQLPLFYASIWCEKRRTKKLVKIFGITEIISDNRYGIRSKLSKSVLLTHQLYIKVPSAFKVFEPLVHLITKYLVSKFDECWVPDYSDPKQSLAGELSHGKKRWSNVKYIGPLSRFSNYESEDKTFIKKIPDVLILISGPEPQRTIFEKQMEARFLKTEKRVLMLCGNPGKEQLTTEGNITKVNHLSTNVLYHCMKHSPKIIARSGYSTIMDLHVLGLKAELLPTPGQPEQEYLAVFINSK